MAKRVLTELRIKEINKLKAQGPRSSREMKDKGENDPKSFRLRSTGQPVPYLAPTGSVGNQEPTATNKQADRDKHQPSSPIEGFGQKGLSHLVAKGINVPDHDDGEDDHPPGQLKKG